MKKSNIKNKNEFKAEFNKRIYSFVLELVKFVDLMPKSISSQVMAKQLIRSGSSVGANYFESRASSSKKEFTNFFRYSLKSANESIFWLKLIKDTKKGNYREAKRLLEELNEIRNILAASVLTLNKNMKNS